jgi:pilus assembly protein CpaE
VRNIGTASSAASVVLVGLTMEEMGRVRETLVGEAVLPSNPVGFGDALGQVQRARPDVVIVSFSQGTEAPLAIAQALVRDFPDTVLVALSEASTADAILSAMRVGYKEFVVLPDDANRLRQVVKDSAFAPTESEDTGMVVSAVGAKGGVGTTLLTAHVAAELAGIHRVMAIDMDMSMGDLASIMDLNPQEDLASVLPRAHRMDERMLTSAATVHSSKVHVLAQPGEPQPGLEYTADDVYSVINASAQAYQFVLIDCGSAVDEATLMACNVSDMVLLITEPTVISVRDAFRRIRLLTGLGIERDRIKLVVNRFHKAAYVALSDIENNLGIQVAATVVDDPRTVGQAVNEGKLIRDINRRAEVARDISALMAIVTDDGDPVDVEAGEDGSGFFFGLFGRG